MAAIPMDVVESCILPRLPVKTLVRFKCVSKSWKTLISSSKFIQLHQRYANRLLLIPELGDTLLKVYNLDSPLDPSFLCPYPNPYLNQHRPRPWAFEDHMTILASCEFFVLMGYGRIYKIERLFLLNPSTLSYHRLIPTNVEQRCICSEVKYGLYFDEANDDCKVVRMASFYSNNADAWNVRIYSCKTNLWRVIEHKLISDPYHRINFNSVECVHNNLLYVISDFNSGSSVDLRIHCFDIQTEQWTNDVLFPHHLIVPILCILDGSLCVLGNIWSDDEEGRRHLSDLTTYCMWVLDESGAKKSWVKLLTITTRFFESWSFRPIAYRKGSRHKLLCRRSNYQSGLFWYDLKHNIATKAEFNGGFGEYAIDHICKESLISFSRWPNESH